TAGPVPPLGGNLVYTLTVKNQGPGAATGVTVSDPLPVGTSYVSSVASQGLCLNGSGTVTCSIGNLANGATAQITITVTVTKPGAIVNTATVTGNETDPSTANNTASVSVTVQGPKLALTKQVQGGALKVGTNFTYTLTLKNSGPGSTTGATISDPLPAGQT